MTKDDFFFAIERNKEALTNLIAKYHPRSHREGVESPVKNFLIAFEMEDHAGLTTLFDTTWFGMPETVESHDEPGFHMLCLLCEGVD